MQVNPNTTKILKAYFSKTAIRRIASQMKTGEIPPPMKKYLSVFFIDLVGFSTIAEMLEADQVMEILNTVFQQIDLTIENYNGDIDKFMGDALLVTFETAEDAVRCGIEILRKDLDIINSKLEYLDIPEIQVHMGINTGWVVQGNVGSSRRSETTVIGDGVNVASRVQSIAPANELWITASTISALGELQKMFNALERTKLKGRTQKVMIYSHTNRISGNHTILCFEPDERTLEQLRTEMAKIGITNIINLVNPDNSIDMHVIQNAKAAVIGPSIEPQTMNQVVYYLKDKVRKHIPIIPIVRKRLNEESFSLFGRLGLDIYIPLYKKQGLSKLNNVLLTHETKEVPVRTETTETPVASRSQIRSSWDSAKVAMPVHGGNTTPEPILQLEISTESPEKKKSTKQIQLEELQKKVSYLFSAGTIHVVLKNVPEQGDIHVFKEVLTSYWVDSLHKKPIHKIIIDTSYLAITEDLTPMVSNLLRCLDFYPTPTAIRISIQGSHDDSQISMAILQQEFPFQFEHIRS